MSFAAAVAAPRASAAPLLTRFRLPPIGVELAALAVVLGAAIAMRLPSLGEPANNYDEGVHLESLLLMARGHQPFVEITASQGPLHLFSQLPLFLLFGESVAAGRATSVTLSMVTLGGIWWIGRQLAGPWAGVAAALLLALSPTYVRFSRQALADIPALAPAILAVGAALLFRRTGERYSLIAAALLLALGLLMKPIIVPVAGAVAMLVWRPSRAGWRDLGLFVGVFGAALATVLMMLGPNLVLDQVFGFRDEARIAYGWSAGRNWDLLVDKLDQEQTGFYVLAATGAALAIFRRRFTDLAMAVWAAASLGLLLGHSPLRYHHMVLVLPPLAILGGSTVATAAGVFGSNRRRGLVGGIAIVAMLFYTVGLPEIARRDALLLDNVDSAGAGSDSVDDLVSVAERARRLSDPNDFILTDSPYVAFLADRRVPPQMVDPSEARLRSGDLTDEEVLAAAIEYEPKLVVFWNGRFNGLPRFMEWVAANYREDRRFGAGDDGQRRALMRARER